MYGLSDVIVMDFATKHRKSCVIHDQSHSRCPKAVLLTCREKLLKEQLSRRFAQWATALASVQQQMHVRYIVPKFLKLIAWPDLPLNWIHEMHAFATGRSPWEAQSWRRSMWTRYQQMPHLLPNWVTQVNWTQQTELFIRCISCSCDCTKGLQTCHFVIANQQNRELPVHILNFGTMAR